jgi:threonine/homoserine/homoserine lactone efflux protein
MGGAIGDILPLALGVAISPVPIIAAILMLLSPRARGASIAFLLGWVIGIVVAVTAFTLLSSALPASDSDGSKPVQGIITIMLGLVLMGIGVKQWQGRPRGDAAPVLPSWMSAIDTMTPAKSLGLGFLLAAVNPKNLIMAVGAGVIIGSADLGSSALVITILVFTALAASTVAVPVVAYLIAADRMSTPLQALRQWLVRENAVVMAVLMGVIGVVMIGKGLGRF